LASWIIFYHLNGKTKPSNRPRNFIHILPDMSNDLLRFINWQKIRTVNTINEQSVPILARDNLEWWLSAQYAQNTVGKFYGGILPPWHDSPRFGETGTIKWRVNSNRDYTWHKYNLQIHIYFWYDTWAKTIYKYIFIFKIFETKKTAL
jgi:hypothetical protein